MGAFPPVDCLNVLRVEDMDNDLLSDHLLREPFFKNSLADFFRQMFSGKKNSQRAPRGTPQFCHFFLPYKRVFLGPKKLSLALCNLFLAFSSTILAISGANEQVLVLEDEIFMPSKWQNFSQGGRISPWQKNPPNVFEGLRNRQLYVSHRILKN